MIQLSSITNAISSAALSATHNAAFYTKKLCVDSKVDSVFRATVGVAKSYPYIALLGATIGIYCCRGQIKNLVTKVIQAAGFLCTKTIESLKNLANLFKQSPAVTEPVTDATTPPISSPPGT